MLNSRIPDTSDDHSLRKPRKYEGMFVVDSADSIDPLASSGVSGKNVRALPDEDALIAAIVDAVREHDPDLLVGYEVQMASWGYLVERAAARGLNLPPLISRLPERERESRDASISPSTVCLTNSTLQSVLRSLL